MLIVLFALKDDGGTEYYKHLSGRLKKFSKKDLIFEKANKRDFVSQVEKADVVFLEGGDTNRMLTTLRGCLDLKELFIGKTIIGSSAGAYALGALGTSHGEIHARKGLGVLPLRIVCHYKSNSLPPSDTSLEEIKNTYGELELLLLKDYEYKVFYTS